MPLRSVKIEVEYCLDAKMAQDELLALARALAVEDTRLHYEVTGEPDITTFNDPKIVCEVMEGGKGMLWRGRLVAEFYTLGTPERTRDLDPGEDVFVEIAIPGYGRYTLRRDMTTDTQVEMFVEVATDNGIPQDVVDFGIKMILDALA